MEVAGIKRTLKECVVCDGEFKPFTTTQKTCSTPCAIEHVEILKQEKALKALRKDTRERKQKLKSKSDWLKEAQVAINKYVRLRDAGKPCISCDKPDDGSHQRHASHYRSVGACSVLRFNLKNIHTSCQQCNTTKSGNIIEYRIRLVALYDESFVQWLESQNKAVKYEIEYLKRLKSIFLKRVRLMEKRYNCI